MLGSRLFLRRVSGARVVVGKDATVGGVRLEGYGAHRAGYGHVYVTAAAALGGQREDVDRFVEGRGGGGGSGHLAVQCSASSAVGSG